MSAKKRRGKQRKAAAAAAAAATPAPRSNQGDGGRSSVAAGGRRGGQTRTQREYSIERSEPSDVLEAISRGEKLATEFVVYDLFGHKGGGIANAFLEHLVDDGLLRIVLAFVNQCERASMAEVVTEQRAPINEVAPNPVVEPHFWVALLANLLIGDRLPTKETTDRCRMELAHGIIGPLVSCFGSTPREFFKSKKHWHHCLQSFLYLINRIAMASDAIGVFFEHKGLDDILAQSLFLGTHRPDIVEESKVFGGLDCQQIAHAGLNILNLAIASWKKRSCDCSYFDECATRRLNIIGRTPIVSKPYRTNGRVPLVIGMIEQLQTQQHQNNLAQYFSILRAFTDVGCVDKDVISTALGSAQMLNYNAAVVTTNIMVVMLNPMVEGAPTPCDNKFAFAIDQGLLIVSLGLLVKHQNVRSGHLLAELQTLLRRAFSVSTQMKSSKAIARQRNKVIEMIRNSERALAKRSEESQKMLRLIKMIVLLQENIESHTRHFCHWCHKSVPEEEIMRCIRCVTFYCSRSCQRQDWERGSHARSCANGKTATGEKENTAKREEILDRNVCAVARKLVQNDNLGLLNEFAILENDALDCVVLINLVKPPIMTVMLASSFLSAEGDSAKRAQFEQRVDKNRANGAVTSVTRYLLCSPNEPDRVKMVTMGHLDRTVSWRDALKEFKNRGSLLDVSDRERLFFRY